MARVVLGLTGKRYSGKSEAALWLANRGFRVLDFTADVLAPILKRQNKPITRSNLIELATELRAKHGPDILARKLAKKAKGEKIAISGIRFPQEVAYFRKIFGKRFRLVAITASARARWLRAAMVAKGEGRLGFSQFLAVEQAITERHIPKLIRQADFRIANNSTKAVLYRKIDGLLSKLNL